MAGKMVRVSGMQQTSIENVANGAISTLPSGLIGVCDLLAPQFAKITFRKDNWENQHRWAHITNQTDENKSSGVFIGYLNPILLVRLDVLQDDPHLRPTGNAMGKRG